MASQTFGVAVVLFVFGVLGWVLWKVYVSQDRVREDFDNEP